MPAFAHLLDLLLFGVVLLDAGGGVVFSNRFARSLLAQGDGLALDGKVLHFLRSSDQARLGMLLADVRQLVPHRHFLRAMALDRPSGRWAYSIVAIALPKQRESAESRFPALLMLISDRERSADVNPALLRYLFGLTTKEATLTALLAAGRTLQQAAVEQEITTKTARVHLRNIFGKTGVRRQSELARIVFTSVAMLGSLSEPLPA